MFQGPVQESILRRAQDKGLVEIAVHDLRSWTTDRHHVVDDAPYGGGVGKILKPEPAFQAVEALSRGEESTVIVLTPQGVPFTQAIAVELAQAGHLILLCGRYEGFYDRSPVALARELGPSGPHRGSWSYRLTPWSTHPRRPGCDPADGFICAVR
jgi:tRNA (guanine37-N1)-methyltransferase